MNEKMVAVIRQMFEHPELISSIYKQERELYFIYKDHFFSISNSIDGYSLYIYPNWSRGIEQLARDPNADFSTLSDALTDKERDSVIGDLYNNIKNMLLGLDKALDSILATA